MPKRIVIVLVATLLTFVAVSIPGVVGGKSSIYTAMADRLAPTQSPNSDVPQVVEYPLDKSAQISETTLRFWAPLHTDVTVAGATWDSVDSDVIPYYRFKVNGTWTGWNHAGHGRVDEGSQRDDQLYPARAGSAPFAMTDATEVEVHLSVSAGQALPTHPVIIIISSQSDPADGQGLSEDDPRFTVPAGFPVKEPQLTADDLSVATRSASASTPAEGDSVADAELGKPSILVKQNVVQVPAPPIHSRAEWGANERVMTWDPEYGEVLGAVVHHTETGGADASPEQIPQLINSIYHYHAVSRGWGDIGYNVIIDRFGRAWQGRAGRLEKQPIGAHAMGVNSKTFGVSLLGSYSNEGISPAAQETLVKVLAWKLGRNGIDPQGDSTYRKVARGRVTRLTVPSIAGHRQVGSTNCPGDALFNQLPEIRQRVADYIDSVANQFWDVPPTSEFGYEIYWMKKTGLSRGWPDGSFRPFAPINRDAMIAFLYRLAGSPATGTAPSFVDVPQNSQFAKEIAWAENINLTTGWPDGTFRPTEPVTREAIAAFLHRFCGKFPAQCVGVPLLDVAEDTQQFVDIPASAPFYADIQWLGQTGISTGWKEANGNHSFRPHEFTQRQALAAFIYRMNKPRY